MLNQMTDVKAPLWVQPLRVVNGSEGWWVGFLLVHRAGPVDSDRSGGAPAVGTFAALRSIRQMGKAVVAVA